MLFGGRRRCEVLGLRMANVNLGERRLFITEGKGGRQRCTVSSRSQLTSRPPLSADTHTRAIRPRASRRLPREQPEHAPIDDEDGVPSATALFADAVTRATYASCVGYSFASVAASNGTYQTREEAQKGGIAGVRSVIRAHWCIDRGRADTAERVAHLVACYQRVAVARWNRGDGGRMGELNERSGRRRSPVS